MSCSKFAPLVASIAAIALIALAGCSSVSEPPALDGEPDAAVDTPVGSCAVSGNDLIYVVDTDGRLLSFDPRNLATSQDPFTLIGELDCPTEEVELPPIPGLPPLEGLGPSPFSMSVDRQGTAWVLHSSGELMRASISDASCTASDYQRGQGGYDLFGMGFVSDEPGSATETLFIAGENGDLGQLKTDGLNISSVGKLPAAEYNPELTGTGDAELYGYFPGEQNSFVARLNKRDSSIEESWPLETLSAGIRGWAFAHWGGKFYIFISTEGAGVTSQVRVLDPATGEESVVVSDSPYLVVGAGVSTCAPVVIQ